MAELQLYRLRIFESDLFPLQRSRAAMLRAAIEEKPSMEPNDNNRLKKSKWHIGNVENLDSDGYAFAVGRQAPSNVSKYDEETGDFYSSVEDDAPFTIAIIDVILSILAIEVRRGVATTDTIAQRIGQLIHSSDTFREANVRIVVDAIYDSETFLSLLRNAYQIKRFIFDFYPPNPDDPEMDIQQPVERWAQFANGAHGRLAIDGNSLNLEALDPVARGLISSGSQVIATVRETASSDKVRRISSKTQKVGTEVERLDIDSGTSLSQALDSSREVYFSNRGELQNDNQ